MYPFFIRQCSQDAFMTKLEAPNFTVAPKTTNYPVIDNRTKIGCSKLKNR